MALDSKTIVSLQDARLYLSKSSTNTADDQLIDMLTQHASEAMAKELGVDNVVSTTYREFHDSHKGYNLWTHNYPIISVDLISVGRDDALTINYGGGDASYATVEVTKTTLRLRKRVNGTLTASTFTLTDYATMTTLETAVELISGWSMIIATDFGSYAPAALVPVPALDANEITITLGVPDQGENECEIEERWGKLYNPYGWKGCGSRSICVEYTAGYAREDLPQPLKAACLMVIKSMYDGVKRDLSVKSEQIGDYRYQLADHVSTVTSPLVQEMLGPFRRQSLFGI